LNNHKQNLAALDGGGNDTGSGTSILSDKNQSGICYPGKSGDRNQRDGQTPQEQYYQALPTMPVRPTAKGGSEFADTGTTTKSSEQNTTAHAGRAQPIGIGPHRRERAACGWLSKKQPPAVVAIR
jgi:hypothetical protein